MVCEWRFACDRKVRWVRDRTSTIRDRQCCLHPSRARAREMWVINGCAQRKAATCVTAHGGQGWAAGGGGGWGLKLGPAKLWGSPPRPSRPDDLLIFSCPPKAKIRGRGSSNRQQVAWGVRRGAVPGRPRLPLTCKLGSITSFPPIPGMGEGVEEQKKRSLTANQTAQGASTAVFLPAHSDP